MIRRCLLVWTLGLSGLAFAHEGLISLIASVSDAETWQLRPHAPGDDVTDGGADNPGLELIPLLRYSFDVSAVNSRRHPLAFYGPDGELLLSQGRTKGSFEDDRYVAFEENRNILSFNLTPELGELLRSYGSAARPDMGGEIRLAGRAFE